MMLNQNEDATKNNLKSLMLQQGDHTMEKKVACASTDDLSQITCIWLG